MRAIKTFVAGAIVPKEMVTVLSDNEHVPPAKLQTTILNPAGIGIVTVTLFAAPGPALAAVIKKPIVSPDGVAPAPDMVTETSAVAFTFTITPAEVVVLPTRSVARAVMVCDPSPAE